MLALHREVLANWQAVRRDCDVKENHAYALLARLGETTPGQGRKTAMRSLGREWSGLLQVCPELRRLGERIAQRLESS